MSFKNKMVPLIKDVESAYKDIQGQELKQACKTKQEKLKHDLIPKIEQLIKTSVSQAERAIASAAQATSEIYL